MTNKQELEERWPHLTIFLKALWYDNVPLGISHWKPNFQDTSKFDELEQQALNLLIDYPGMDDWDGIYVGDDSVWENFIYGGEDDRNGIIDRYGVRELDEFINSCFDGDLAFQWQPRDT